MNKKLVLEYVALRRLATAFVTGSLLTTTGCVKIGHEVRYSEPGRALHRIEDPYYHSPQTGRIVMRPKKAAQYCYSEPAFYGFEATCWQRWPDGWVGCPCQEEVIAVSAAAHGPEQLPATEAESSPNIPAVTPSADPSTPPVEQPSPSDRGTYDPAPGRATVSEQGVRPADATRIAEVPVPPTATVENEQPSAEVAPRIDLQATVPPPAPAPSVDVQPPTQRRTARRNIPSLPVASAETMPKSSADISVEREPTGSPEIIAEPAPPATTATAAVGKPPVDVPPPAITSLSDPLEEITSPVRDWNARLSTTSGGVDSSFAANESVEVPSSTPTEKAEGNSPVTQPSETQTAVATPREQAIAEPVAPLVTILTDPLDIGTNRPKVSTERLVSDLASQPNPSELKFAAARDAALGIRHRWSPETANPDAATLAFRVQSTDRSGPAKTATVPQPALSARPVHESKNELRLR